MKIGTERESRNKGLGGVKSPADPRRRALVIEDEPGMRAIIQEVLASAGMEAVIPAKSAETDGHLQEGKFDVVLIGHCAPSGDGIELVGRIRRSGFNQKTPIILISDDQRPGALSRSFEAGASFFVYKPIDKPQLMKLLHVTQGAIEHERRRFRRVPVQAKVRLRSDKAVLGGETIDISLNGALVRVPHTLPLGSLVEVSLHLLAGTPPIVGLGSVVRISSNEQMGIKLDRFPASEIGRLQECLLLRVSE